MACSGVTDSPSVLLLHNVDPSWSPPERERAIAEVGAMVDALRVEGFGVAERAVRCAHLGEALSGIGPDGVIVLNVCEGLPGVPNSEALVACELDQRGFTYTGSPPCTLELSADKSLTKRRLWQLGVPTPEWRKVATPQVQAWDRFPAIVKPAREHGSLGVDSEAVVDDHDALTERAMFVLDGLGQPAIVEPFIDGREFHVSVFGDGTLRVLPPAEIDFSAFADPRERLCSFDSKFTPGSLHWENLKVLLPAALAAEEERELARVAIAAYRAIGCRDYARIDLRQDSDTFTVLDVNPNCDLSEGTSTALAAELALGSYGALLRRIVGLAAQRHRSARERIPASPLFTA